jgi:hypothetical protein
MRYWKGSFTISLDKRATCGSIGCFGIRPTCEYQRDAGKRVSLSHWISIQHAVVSASSVHHKRTGTIKIPTFVFWILTTSHRTSMHYAVVSAASVHHESTDTSEVTSKSKRQMSVSQWISMHYAVISTCFAHHKRTATSEIR